MAVIRSSIDGEGADPHLKAYALIDQLLAITTPSKVEVKGEDQKWIAAGLLNRCRHLLRAIVILSESNMLFVSAGLVRQVFEHVAMGTWLVMDEGAYDKVLGAYVKHLEGTQNVHTDVEKITYKNIAWFVANQEDDENPVVAKTLPKLEDRLVGPLKDHYLMYRVLCGLDHPGLNTALVSIVTRDAQSLDGPPPWGEEQSWLAYAGCLTAGLGVLVDREYGLGRGVQLASIANDLNQELLKWNYRKPSWFESLKRRLGPGIAYQIWWTKMLRKIIRMASRHDKK